MRKDGWEFDRSQQSESLLNEMRGNLFEYLVAYEVACFYGLQSSFENTQHPHVVEQLRHYQSWILKNYPDLVSKIMGLSKKFVQSLEEKEIFKNWPKPESIVVSGKKVGANRNSASGEADIILSVNDRDDQSLYLSLKMCRKNSFINTKSAGAKSFIEKYFDHSVSKSIQEEFNLFIDQSFEQMALELYQLYGLNFTGGFDKAWDETIGSRLPGNQEVPAKEIIRDHYQRLARRLYSIVSQLFTENAEQFRETLLILQGFDNPEVVQLNCLYQNEYEFDSAYALEYAKLKDDFSDLLIEDGIGTSSFHILSKNWSFQIRIKPMNEFTTNSYKINCSLKKL
ncbi:MAG: hypothetical protein ACPGJV_11580 [Bacteriovoracaceae bacterium]